MHQILSILVALTPVAGGSFERLAGGDRQVGERVAITTVHGETHVGQIDRRSSSQAIVLRRQTGGTTVRVSIPRATITHVVTASPIAERPFARPWAEVAREAIFGR